MKFYGVGICAVAPDVAHGAVLGARSIRLQADIYISNELPSALNLIESAFQGFLFCFEPPILAAYKINLYSCALKKRFVHRSPPKSRLKVLRGCPKFLARTSHALTSHTSGAGFP